MSVTVTASSVPLLAVCDCCRDHSTPERPLLWEVVQCPECGGMCSCEGCVVEVAEGYKQ